MSSEVLSWAGLHVRLLLLVWRHLPMEDRPAFAMCCHRWARVAVVALEAGSLSAETVSKAFERFHYVHVSNGSLREAFRHLSYLLFLPPFPPIRASASIQASAHERINQGLVRLIRVEHSDGATRLVVLQNAGMSKTKRHDTWVPFPDAPSAHLDTPTCDCVNWCVCACTCAAGLTYDDL